MKIKIFRAFPDPYRQSMTIYADCLLKSLREAGEAAEDFLPSPLFLSPKPLRYLSQYAAYPAGAAFNQGDINHIIDHAYAHLTHALNAQKTVVTFHDAIWLKYRGQTSSALSAVQRFNLSGLAKAAAIACDSEASKKALFEFIPNPKGKVEVIYPGLDSFFLNAPRLTKRPADLPEDRIYLLHVGHNASYKNIEGLLEILALAAKKIQNVSLVKVGPAFSPEQQKRARELGVESRLIFKGSLSKSALAEIYQAAHFLIQPSQDEGFGFPALEAMASGLCVIASDRGSLPEIIGDGGIFKKPNDIEGFVQSISLLLEDPALRRTYQEKGRKRAAQFTWEETARRCADIYQRVLKS